MKIPFLRILGICFLALNWLNCPKSSAQPYLWQVADYTTGRQETSALADSIFYISEDLFTLNLKGETFIFKSSLFQPCYRSKKVEIKALNESFFAGKSGNFWQLFETKKPREPRAEKFLNLSLWNGQVLAQKAEGYALIPETGEEIACDSIQVCANRLMLYRKDGILVLDSLFAGHFYKTTGSRRRFNDPNFTYLLDDSLWIPLDGSGKTLAHKPGAFWWNDTCVMDTSASEVWLQSPGKRRNRIGDSLVYISPRQLWIKNGKQSFLLFSNGRKVPVIPHAERKTICDSLCALRFPTSWVLISQNGNRYPMKPGITSIGEKTADWVLLKAGKRWGCADHNGIIRISCRYDSLLPASQGLMAAKIGQVWGFLDQYERIRIQPNFQSVQAFRDSVSLVCQDGKWGLIDLKGNPALPCTFDRITQSRYDKWILEKSSWKGIASTRGKILLNTRYSDIIEPELDLIWVTRNGKAGLFNQKGLAIVPLEFSQIVIDQPHQKFVLRLTQN